MAAGCRAFSQRYDAPVTGSARLPDTTDGVNFKKIQSSSRVRRLDLSPTASSKKFDSCPQMGAIRTRNSVVRIQLWVMGESAVAHCCQPNRGAALGSGQDPGTRWFFSLADMKYARGEAPYERGVYGQGDAGRFGFGAGLATRSATARRESYSTLMSSRGDKLPDAKCSLFTWP
jgi:hypothetical protein